MKCKLMLLLLLLLLLCQVKCRCLMWSEAYHHEDAKASSSDLHKYVCNSLHNAYVTSENCSESHSRIEMAA